MSSRRCLIKTTLWMIWKQFSWAFFIKQRYSKKQKIQTRFHLTIRFSNKLKLSICFMSSLHASRATTSYIKFFFLFVSKMMTRIVCDSIQSRFSSLASFSRSKNFHRHRYSRWNEQRSTIHSLMTLHITKVKQKFWLHATMIFWRCSCEKRFAL